MIGSSFAMAMGYAPWFAIELKGITQGVGKSEWGAEEGKQYFVLSLGEIINTKNIDK